MRDLKGVSLSNNKIVGASRIRRAGAGRKSVLDTNPQICEALESLIESVTRGDHGLSFICVYASLLWNGCSRLENPTTVHGTAALLHDDHRRRA